MKIVRHLLAALIILVLSITYASAAPDKSAKAYKKAADYYHKLGVGTKKVSRKELEKNLAMFKEVYKKYPRGSKTAEGFFMSGQLHGELYYRYQRRVDKEKALTVYRTLVRSYPKSVLADDALYRSAEIHMKDGNKLEAVSTFRGLVRWYPKGDMAADAKEKIEKLQADIRETKRAAERSAPKVEIAATPAEPDFKRVRYWSSETYARVVFDISKRINYKIDREETGDRITVDLLGVEGAASLAKVITPESGLIRSIDISSAGNEESRVTIVLKAAGAYNTMELTNPDRIVVDINVEDEADRAAVTPAKDTSATAAALPPVLAPAAPDVSAPAIKSAEDPKSPSAKQAAIAKPLNVPKIEVNLDAPVINPLPAVAAAATAAPDAGLMEAGLVRDAAPKNIDEPAAREIRQASIDPQPNFKIRTIVIDPGHGGKDPGAVGRGGLKEKDVVLDIAKRLQTDLKDRCGCRVLLTRSTDVFIPLEERTAFANTNDADLFISVHANSNRKRKVSGVETYFLSPARSKNEMYVAAQENMMNVESENEDTNDLAFILFDMQSTDKINESSRMAARVQDSMMKKLKSRYNPRNHGVKQAMFYVLHGARMPAILVETSFISNQNEERLLRKPEYRQQIAEGIASGIAEYSRQTQVAFLNGN